MTRRVLWLVLLSVATLTARTPEGPVTPPATSDELFSPTTVHTAHLTFTADQWAALQPVSGGYSGGGGFAGGLQGPDGGRNGVAARQGVVFDYVRGDIEFDGRRMADVAVRYKGNGTYMRGRLANKISLKVDLNKFVKGQKLAGVSTLNFENNITDISWMNEVLAYRLYRDAGVPAPRSSYVRVYVTVAGLFTHEYFGLYSISENVDTNFTSARFGTKDGAILKPSTPTPFTSRGADWAAYNQTYDPKTDLTDAETKRIIEFCTFVSSASDADFSAHLADYLDLDEFARYFSVLVWIANSDSLLQIGQNYYVYLHPKTHKFMFIPWDQDGSFGNFRNAPNWTIYYPWSGANTFLNRVYAVDAFRTAYLARMAEFAKTIFLPERFASEMSIIAPAIRPAVREEGTQWLPGFDQVVSGGAGILPFTRARAAFVLGELAEKP